MAGNQRSDLRAVHRLRAQALPAVLAAHARDVGTAQHVARQIRVVPVHTRVNHGNRHTLTRGLRPQRGNAVLIQPVLAVAHIVTVGGIRALARGGRALRHRRARRRGGGRHLPLRARRGRGRGAGIGRIGRGQPRGRTQRQQGQQGGRGQRPGRTRAHRVRARRTQNTQGAADAPRGTRKPIHSFLLN